MVFNFMWTIHKEQNPQINKRFVQIAPDIEENEHLQLGGSKNKKPYMKECKKAKVASTR